jgi:hypothetical protein
VLTVEDVDRREEGKTPSKADDVFLKNWNRGRGRVVCIRPTRIAIIANGGVDEARQTRDVEKRVSEEGKTKR